MIVARNLKKGVMVEQTLIHRDNIELVVLKENIMTFMYEDGENLCFMDADSFDMVSVRSDVFGWEKNFLVPDLTVSCFTYENEIIKIKLPKEVTLTLVECDETDSSTSYKYAVCETGLKIKVPMLLNVGEQIIVSVSDGTYVGRA